MFICITQYKQLFYLKLQCHVILFRLNGTTQTELAWLIIYPVAGSSEYGNELAE